GLLTELKRREFYEKPSEVKKRQLKEKQKKIRKAIRLDRSN
ncbi:30S ribosomal protein S21, partial [candidate division CPR3 bacterium RIFOXYC2_FULL_35_7]